MFSYDLKTNELFIYDEIGPAWWGLIDGQSVIDALKQMDGQRVTVRINTPGGSVDEGVAIYNALKRHNGGVDTVVDSLAASMGSYLMLAGEKRVIARNARVMIHEPWTIAFGNAAELRKTADILDKYSESLIDDYADSMGIDVADVKSLLADETWYTASEAVAAGLATEIGTDITADHPPAVPEGMFQNTPASILSKPKAGSRNSGKNWQTRVAIWKAKNF